MPSIKKSKTVPYSQRQMYALVNNVEKYSEFVPCCVESTVLDQTNDEIRATLGFSAKGFSKSFTTLNRLLPHKMIEIRLVDGPFRRLEGFWQFELLDEGSSRVSLDLEFEFSTKLISLIFGPLFNQVAGSLVEAFCNRAVQMYAEN